MASLIKKKRKRTRFLDLKKGFEKKTLLSPTEAREMSLANAMHNSRTDAMDKAIQEECARIERKKTRLHKGEKAASELVHERARENEDSVVSHILAGGVLGAILCSTIVFSMAKNAGIDILMCLYLSLATFATASIPFCIIWAVRHRAIATELFLCFGSLCSIFCAAVCRCWACVFWCSPARFLWCGPRRKALPDKSISKGSIYPFMNMRGTRWCGISCQRKMDALLCCLCQRGLCLGWTPSCFVCPLCHTSCFTTQKRKNAKQNTEHELNLEEQEALAELGVMKYTEIPPTLVKKRSSRKGKEAMTDVDNGDYMDDGCVTEMQTYSVSEYTKDVTEGSDEDWIV